MKIAINAEGTMTLSFGTSIKGDKEDKKLLIEKLHARMDRLKVAMDSLVWRDLDGSFKTEEILDIEVELCEDYDIEEIDEVKEKRTKNKLTSVTSTHEQKNLTSSHN